MVQNKSSGASSSTFEAMKGVTPSARRVPSVTSLTGREAASFAMFAASPAAERAENTTLPSGRVTGTPCGAAASSRASWALASAAATSAAVLPAASEADCALSLAKRALCAAE
jgi:hypothetical protein